MKQIFIPGIGGLLNDELAIDLFAGGGGASEGVEEATGRSPDVAVNHSEHAIAMHKLNHPHTLHRCESIYVVSPREVTKGQRVGLVWASPSCTHFSRARGAKPVTKQERGLGWMILRWAALTHARVVIAENVAEWQTWGPVRRGRPVRKFSGKYFNQLVQQLRDLGYVVEWRVLIAADYGAPTTRKRLYLIARRDGKPIVWPEPTHIPKPLTKKAQREMRRRGLKPYRTAAECIDWSDLGTSIFDRKKPLADATCRRIVAGIVKYVLNGRPFLVTIDNQSNGARGACNIDAPVSTIVQENRHAVVSAFIAKHNTGVVGQDAGQPLGTVTGIDHHSVVAAHLVTCNHQGEGHRGGAADEPLSTITASHDARGVVACHLTKFQENSTGQSPDVPLDTVMAGAQRFGVVGAYLTEFRHGSVGSDPSAPAPTITATNHQGIVGVHLMTNTSGHAPGSVEDPLATVTTGNHHAMVAANLVQMGYGEREGQDPRTLDIDKPLGTVTAGGLKHAIVGSHLIQIGDRHGGGNAPLDEPMRTMLTTPRFAMVAAFISSYYSGGGIASGCDEPLPTVVTMARHGLVTLVIDGVSYAIVDIFLRMLTPRELANAQGFSPKYILTGTQREQIARIGNSVCPPVAAALVKANLESAREERAA